MGIPSYYRKLVNTLKGLVVKQAPVAKALYFDFNCLIYYVVRKPNTSILSYPGEEGKVQWELTVIDEIVRYVVKVWEEVGSPQSVFLGIDGVVPMAKIRQQRLRRFKSIWLAREETALGIRKAGPSWDTNCITPGTAFMEKLGLALETLCSKRKGWTVSTASEPGEGEHKIMKLLRNSTSTEPIVIYGLDADLVLLTLLNSKSPAYLMREDEDTDRYAYLSTEHLKQALWPQRTDTQILEYVAAMSLLGNDFLPHSLTVKIKEEGHSLLISELSELHKAGVALIEQQEGLYRFRKEALMFLFERWAAKEKDLLFHAIKRKMQMRGRPGQENLLENRPLEWCVEKSLLKHQTTWSEYYTKEWLMCSSKQSLDAACTKYFEGLQWVLDYYTGQRPVDTEWYFPYYVPPLWSDLKAHLQTLDTLPLAPVFNGSKVPIKPYEQLAMVLPLESWHLLDKAPKSIQNLPATKPHGWPTRFDFFSAGRLWMWECEPIIPLLRINDVRVSDERIKQV
jgi:5'-3' exonuclease